MMRAYLLSLAAVGALALPAAADWKKMDGQPVPDISAKEWLHAGKQAPSAADLRGKVWLLEFFTTT
jgi:hypothetical protein